MLKVLGVLGAFIRRDFLEQNRYSPSWIGRAVGIFVQIYSTFFVAQLFNGSPSLDAYGGNYFNYAIVGTITLQLLYAITNALPEVIGNAQYQGTLEPLLTSPSPLWLILVGACSYNILIEIVNLVVFGLAAWLLAHPDFLVQPRWEIVISLIILHGLCAWGLGVITASFLLAYKVATPLKSWILIGCSLLSGYFYPVSVLPVFLQTLAALFPFTYGIEALRLALQGRVILGAIAIFACFTVVILALARWSFHKALIIARQDGTLTYQ
jgi:ABC-2 type transport system permease protein